MITISNVRFQYQRKKNFSIDSVSVSIPPGEIFSLLGPNGAGKTTLIRILSGLIIAQSGKVSICGFDLIENEYDARRSLGLVLGDERTFYFRLSGAQNLEFFGGLYGLNKGFLKKRIPEVLEMVGLKDDAKLQYMRYSTGMKKRLALARALLHDPPVFLLDEPNSGVDPKSARSIREIIFDLKGRGKTILLTTHDMNEADKMADRIGFLREGRLIKIGPVSEFKKVIKRNKLEIEFAGAYDVAALGRINHLIQILTDSAPFLSVAYNHPVMEIMHNGKFNLSQILKVVADEGPPIVRTSTVEPSLEDVFLKLAE